MAILRSIPRKLRGPSLRNAVMIDSVRGVLRVRKWPRKRGKPRSALQQFWVDWFTQANLLAKYADGMTQALAIKLTKGSGLYPRDIMLQAMRGRLYWWTDDTGQNWYPMAAILDVSKTLDLLAETVGSVLVRASDRWHAAVAGNPGDLLTQQPAGLPPKFSPLVAPPANINGALATKSANQSIANGTVVNITFDQEVYDHGPYHDNAVNPSRFTMIAASGFVICNATAYWASNTNGVRVLDIKKNGAAVAGGGRITDPRAEGEVGQALTSCPIPFVAGDYFELVVFQTSGGSLNILNTVDFTRMSVQVFA